MTLRFSRSDIENLVLNTQHQITPNVLSVMLSIIMKNTVNRAPMISFIFAAAFVDVMYSWIFFVEELKYAISVIAIIGTVKPRL